MNYDAWLAMWRAIGWHAGASAAGITDTLRIAAGLIDLLERRLNSLWWLYA